MSARFHPLFAAVCVWCVLATFGAPLCATPGPPGGWVIETGLSQGSPRLESSVTLGPETPARGGSATLEIVIANPADAPRTLALTATLNRMALFVDASHGGVLVEPETAPSLREIEWPPLRLPARSLGELTLRVLVRRVAAGDLTIDVDGYSFEGSETVDLVAHVPSSGMTSATDARAADGGSGGPWLWLFWILPALAFGLLVTWAIVRSRRAADDPTRRLLGRATAATFAALLWIVGLSLLAQLVDAGSKGDETTCTVLDRRLDIETRVLRSDSSRTQTTVERAIPMLALRYEVAGMARVGEGFAPEVADAGRDDLERFAPGSRVPCWVDPDDPGKVTVVPGVGGGSIVLTLAILAMATGLSWTAWRWPTIGRPVARRAAAEAVEPLSPGRRSWSERARSRRGRSDDSSP